jgi:hypothetical protein
VLRHAGTGTCRRVKRRPYHDCGKCHHPTENNVSIVSISRASFSTVLLLFTIVCVSKTKKMQSPDYVYANKPPVPVKSPLRYVHNQQRRHGQHGAGHSHGDADYLDQHYAGVYATINELAELIESHRFKPLVSDQFSVASTTPTSTTTTTMKRKRRYHSSITSSASLQSSYSSSPAPSLYSQPSASDLDYASLTSASTRTSSSFEGDRSRLAASQDSPRTPHPQSYSPDGTPEVMTNDVFQLIEQLPPVIYERDKLVSFRYEDLIDAEEKAATVPLFPAHPAVRPRTRTVAQTPVQPVRPLLEVPSRRSSLRRLRKSVSRYY